MTPATTSAQIQTEATIRIADFTTLPNLLSLARIAGVAAAVLLYFEGHPRVTVILGTAACLTDHLDGYLARRLWQESVLGAMLDQAADSFTTAIAMAMLVIAGGFSFVFLLIFLLREFWVATVRRYAALGHVEIPSHILGKLATAFMYYAMLLMAIALMLDIPEAIAPRMRPLALFGMAAGLALSCLSGVRYTLVLAGKAQWRPVPCCERGRRCCSARVPSCSRRASRRRSHGVRSATGTRVSPSSSHACAATAAWS